VATVASAGELGDELRRIAADLPLGLVATAVTFIDQARIRLIQAFQGSNRPEAAELLGLLEQLAQTTAGAHQLASVMQSTIEVMAARIGSGDGEGGLPTPAGGERSARAVSAPIHDAIPPALADRFEEAARKLPHGVPAGWLPRLTDNKKGVVFQRSGASGNADMIRVMEPTELYPAGHIRAYNAYGQPVDRDGKPGSRAATHIPLSDNAPWSWWPKG
jgi:hypothetical protein